MDSITHIALGGLLGEICFGKQLGKRAMVLGAISQTIPDFDVLSSLWLDTPGNLLTHRGLTHSFLFAALISPVLAAIASWFSKKVDVKFWQWLLFFLGQIVIHLLLDSLNAYGIGWLEPFSSRRFSFHTFFVADPLYSIWLIAALLALLTLPRASNDRVHWAFSGLILSTGYLIYALTNKYKIDRDVNRILHQQQVSHIRYFTTPTPLNTWLWMVLAEQQNGYQIGYRSIFDRKDTIAFHYFPRNDSLISSFREREDIKLLIRFSQGYYTAEQRGDTVIFNDLRFGQRLGWDDPAAKFVFQYYVTPPSENKFTVQRGRFAGWNSERAGTMFRRIRGN